MTWLKRLVYFCVGLALAAIAGILYLVHEIGRIGH